VKREEGVERGESSESEVSPRHLQEPRCLPAPLSWKALEGGSQPGTPGGAGSG